MMDVLASPQPRRALVQYTHADSSAEQNEITHHRKQHSLSNVRAENAGRNNDSPPKRKALHKERRGVKLDDGEETTLREANRCYDCYRPNHLSTLEHDSSELIVCTVMCTANSVVMC